MTVGYCPWQHVSLLSNLFEVACHTLILKNHANGFNLFFALAASVISRVGSAKVIGNQQVFALDVLEVMSYSA